MDIVDRDGLQHRGPTSPTAAVGDFRASQADLDRWEHWSGHSYDDPSSTTGRAPGRMVAYIID